MKNLSVVSLFLLVLIFFSAGTAAGEKHVLFREDFHSLENWKPLYFPKIKKHTTYTIVKKGNEHYLRAESNASASALTYKEKFNVYDYPGIRWRWKVDNTYVKGNPVMKSGDDYPVRVYVVFDYDSEKAGFFERLKNSLIEKLYGELPHSSLNYVWSSKALKQNIVTSPYTDRVKIILLEKGGENIGTWRDEEINIIEDYRKAFGEPPPAVASLAIMNDSDNTGESSVSFLEYLEVYR